MLSGLMSLLLLTAAALAQPADPALDAVVLLIQGDATCAGAFVSPTQVVTAYHCVAAGGKPSVRLRDGTRVVGRVVAARPSRDLALVDVAEGLAPQVLELRDGAVTVGEEAWALGHPYGAREPFGFLAGTLWWSASLGVVSNVGAVAVQVTAPVNPGNSGGPVVDGEGALLGVVSRRLKGDGLGFATAASEVRALLDAPAGPSVFGGELSLALEASVLDAVDGAPTVGARLAVAVRDRLVLSGSYALPLGARWDAVRYGETRFVSADARGGLRQRLGRGGFTTRVDAYGGLTALSSVTSTEEVLLSRAESWAPVVGGAVQLGASALDFGWIFDGTPGGTRRLGLRVAVPGTFAVF